MPVVNHLADEELPTRCLQPTIEQSTSVKKAIEFHSRVTQTGRSMDFENYEPFAIALGLGLLVGLQREWKGTDIAGIRTFPLIALFGVTVGTIDGESVGWISAAGLLAVSMLLVVANLAKIESNENDFGLTTEFAAVLVYTLGVLLAHDYTGPAIVTAGVTAVLLQWKQPLHGFVRRIGQDEFRGLIQLVLISLVILPLLPNEAFGPYDVFNPYKIWTMVVLIVGISLAAYVVYKLLGARVGAILGGVLGGLISSTATTVSYARQAKSNPNVSAMAVLVILIASTVVNVRVLVEIGVVAPQLLRLATWPIVILLLLMSLECGVLIFLVRKDATELPNHENPAQLKAAIIFGALYAAILFVVAWVKDQFGTEALYGVALISGLTDVDAITLSTANLFNNGLVEARVAWRVILMATLSNLIFKGGAVAVLGSRKLLVYVAIAFGIALAGGVALLWWWPDMALESQLLHQ
jgi:uncharacterized membrane protein (DUF4010 family)